MAGPKPLLTEFGNLHTLESYDTVLVLELGWGNSISRHDLEARVLMVV